MNWVEFTQDCEIFKKGDKREFSRDIARDLVKESFAKYIDAPKEKANK